MFNLPDTVDLALSMLRTKGFESCIVGGCVRDLLMGREIHDWDIASNAVPDEVKGVFSDFKIIETGILHGTVTVMVHGDAIEITTYRVDGDYSDNRHPDSVSYTRSLDEDLARRDFTMNAVAYCPERGITDPFGGRADIEKGVIRCVGDAANRFGEDALRILRALRFSSTLGFEIEKNTSAAVFEKCCLLGNISAERINSELTKLLCGDAAGRILRDFKEVLAVPIPELAPMFGFDQKNRHHCYDVWTHTVVTVENVPAVPVLRWAALLHDVGKPPSFSLDKHGEGHFYGHAVSGYMIADRAMQRLRFDNRSRERILRLIKYHDTVIGADEKNIKRWLKRFGEEFVLQLLTLKRADNLAQDEKYRERQAKISEIEGVVKRISAQQACVSLRDLRVNGDDMIAIGLSGRAVGEALDLLLDAVIDERVQNERDALLEYLNAL
ncbi:MAG: HD domain-containing protein [Clostridiales bacterium]|nr:HD domain-containing protein [Clostridiales bacterium]